MPRILLCPSAFYPSLGGVEEICRNLGNELKQKGFEVAVAVNRHPETLPELEQIDGLTVRRFPFAYPNRSFSGLAPILRLPVNIFKFLHFVREFDPDVIHVICSSSNALYCYLVHYLLKKRLVVTLQGEFFMDASNLYQYSVFARFWAGKLLESADVVTACSQYVLDDAKRRFKFSTQVQQVVFNGVDLNETLSLDSENLPSKPFILAVGRFVKNKGFDWLLHSFKELIATYKNIDLVLVGDGPAMSELTDLSKALSLENQVHFVGRKNRKSVTYLFDKCLFFVMPSPVEPFGIVCLEAMRAGKPVVAAARGGPLEFINDCGILVSPLDQTMLYQAMFKLCTDKALLETLGNNGKQMVRNFDWSKIADQYILLYSNVKNVGHSNHVESVN